MKIFLQRELRQAYEYAAGGGQALHVCQSRGFVMSDAPACFRRSAQFAHLFDQDHARLLETARRLGVRDIHVDLCGKPLERAIDQAQERQEQELKTFDQLYLNQWF